MIKLQIAINASEMNLKKEDLTKLKIGLNNKTIEHKFIPLEQLHIPLLMLGEKEESEIESISKKIENALTEHISFNLKLSGMSAYPDLIEGRLLYISVQNTKELRSLQAALSEAFFGPSEVEYAPNLPVVRLKNHRNVTDVLSPYKGRDFGKLHVSELILYQITSGGAYMTYKELKRFKVSLLDQEKI